VRDDHLEEPTEHIEPVALPDAAQAGVIGWGSVSGSVRS
jgi:hypothetical protein